MTSAATHVHLSVSKQLTSGARSVWIASSKLVRIPSILHKAGEGRGHQQRCKIKIDSNERTVQHGFMQGFLGLPLDVIEQAVADSEGDLGSAVDSLLQQAERQPDPATPKQRLPQPQQQQPKHVPLQQNGHSPWHDTPTPPGWHIH